MSNIDMNKEFAEILKQLSEILPPDFLVQETDSCKSYDGSRCYRFFIEVIKK